MNLKESENLIYFFKIKHNLPLHFVDYHEICEREGATYPSNAYLSQQQQTKTLKIILRRLVKRVSFYGRHSEKQIDKSGITVHVNETPWASWNGRF
jgi:hypothetical protein